MGWLDDLAEVQLSQRLMNSLFEYRKISKVTETGRYLASFTVPEDVDVGDAGKHECAEAHEEGADDAVEGTEEREEEGQKPQEPGHRVTYHCSEGKPRTVDSPQLFPHYKQGHHIKPKCHSLHRSIQV